MLLLNSCTRKLAVMNSRKLVFPFSFFFFFRFDSATTVLANLTGDIRFFDRKYVSEVDILETI